MSEPDRLERELAQLSADSEPPAHWQSRVLAAIADERIADELAHLGDEHAPPPDWQRRVLAATIDRPRRRWWWVAVPALAAAAAIALLLWPRAQRVQLAFATERTGEMRRGPPTLVSAGDVAHLTVTGDRPSRALWIFREDRLEAACPGDPRCRASERRLDLILTLAHLGTYKMVALAAPESIPQPAESYDPALAAARRAGYEIDEQVVIAR